MTAAKTAPEPDRSEPSRDASDYLKAGIPLATLAAAVVMGAVIGASGAILALAAGALVGVIATFWASIRTLFGETPLSGADAYALGAPRAEEEQKQAILRALKDLEFERSVGKISEEDYQHLVAKYRAEAKRLLRLLDEDAEPRREQVESLVQKRLRRAGLVDAPASASPFRDGSARAAGDEAAAGGAVTEDEGDEAADAEREEREEHEEAAPAAVEAKAAVPAVVEAKAAVQEAQPSKKKRGGKKGAAAEKKAAPPKREEPAAATARGRVCSSCGTSNDEDAVFCKKCGARQEPPSDEARDEAAEGGDQGKSEAGA